jgi:hypothetical protein
VSTFQVVEDYTGRVILRTDDWVEACWTAHESLRDVDQQGRGRDHNMATVVGVHPSHEFVDGRCIRDGAWANGSYGSQAPCGYDWSNDSLISALKRERAALVPDGMKEPQ